MAKGNRQWREPEKAPVAVTEPVSPVPAEPDVVREPEPVLEALPAEEPVAEPAVSADPLQTLADVAKREERAQKTQEQLIADDELQRLAKDQKSKADRRAAMKAELSVGLEYGWSVYESTCEQANIVVRGRPFRNGEMFRASDEQMADYVQAGSAQKV